MDQYDFLGEFCAWNRGIFVFFDNIIIVIFYCFALVCNSKAYGRIIIEHAYKRANKMRQPRASYLV